jgi:hypothetical protein
MVVVRAADDPLGFRVTSLPGWRTTLASVRVVRNAK